MYTDNSWCFICITIDILKRLTMPENLFRTINHLKLQYNETSNLVAREMFPQEGRASPFADPWDAHKRKSYFFPVGTSVVADSIVPTSWNKNSQLNTNFIGHVRYNSSGMPKGKICQSKVVFVTFNNFK